MNFTRVIGQDRAISLLEKYISRGEFRGGYIFSGPADIGKRLTAMILAKKLNCAQAQESPCGVCASCVKIEKNQHPDVHLIDNGQDEIKIDDVRSLRQRVNFRPYEGNYKVFIIDFCHRLNSEAANSLLKVLEESPADTIIILITDKPQALFKTITSRCKTIKFSSLPRVQLESVLESEYKQTSDRARFLAYYSEGRIALALRLLEAGVFDEKNALIDSFAFTGRQKTISGPVNKTQMRLLFNVLAMYFRDIYFIKSGIGVDEIINLDRKNDLLKLAKDLSFAQLDTVILKLTESLGYLEKNINPRLLLCNLGAELWKA